MNNSSGTDLGDWLIGSGVRRNPEGLLLLAAGCALMMRSGRELCRQRLPQQLQRLPQRLRQLSARERGLL